MPGRLELALLLVPVLCLITPRVAHAQRGPALEVAVLAPNSPPSGASVSGARLLDDAKTRELLLNGFPTAMRFRLELWRSGGLFNELESATQWEMLVRYDPYHQQYLVVRRQGQALEDFGGFTSLGEVETLLNRPFQVALRPRRTGERYYYNVTVDIETLSVSDLDELQRWLSGELQPAVRGKRAPLSALRRGIGTLLSRVLGGETRHYEARSATFRS